MLTLSNISFDFLWNKKKALESLRGLISFFIVPHAAIVDNMRTAAQR